MWLRHATELVTLAQVFEPLVGSCVLSGFGAFGSVTRCVLDTLSERGARSALRSWSNLAWVPHGQNTGAREAESARPWLQTVKVRRTAFSCI
jgi:hypothetical protein